MEEENASRVVYLFLSPQASKYDFANRGGNTSVQTQMVN
jgi:hypothetical protein